MPRKVILWTAPRCISTAFERCIIEIDDCKVFHEPFSASYHFGPERQSPRYLNQSVDDSASYKEVVKLLSKEWEQEYIFSKDMAYAIENYFDILLHKEMQEFQHVFLIRHPCKTIPSLYKASVNFELTGWNYFDPIESGFKQMFELFSFIRENLNQEPVVINSDDIQAAPKDTMQIFCKAVGFPFSESILEWQPGPMDSWSTWNGWHDNALKSSGFKICDRQTLDKIEDVNKFPIEVRQSIKESLPFYNELQKHCISNKISQLE